MRSSLSMRLIVLIGVLIFSGCAGRSEVHMDAGPEGSSDISSIEQDKDGETLERMDLDSLLPSEQQVEPEEKRGDLNPLPPPGLPGIRFTVDRTSWSVPNESGDPTETVQHFEVTGQGYSFYELYVFDGNDSEERFYDERNGILHVMSHVLEEMDDGTPQTLTQGYCVDYSVLTDWQKPFWVGRALHEKETLLSIDDATYDNRVVDRIELLTTAGEREVRYVSREGQISLLTERYDMSGMLILRAVVTDIEFLDVLPSRFVAPKNLVWIDHTLDLFTSGEKGDPLLDGLSELLTGEPFSLVLTEESTGREIELFSDGTPEKVATISWVMDMHETPLQVITIWDGEHIHTIALSKSKASRHPSSSNWHNWLSESNLGFRGTKKEGGFIHYIFRDMGPGTVSDLVSWYEYVIDQETHRLEKVVTWLQDEENEREHQGYKSVWLISERKPGDMSVFQISMDELEMYVHDYHDDGEHAPVWWE